MNNNPSAPPAGPRPVLDLKDATALVVGIVVGAGIFQLPALIAANTGDGKTMMLAWLLGGVISLLGALCYAELATAHPNAGGEYHFLQRAYGLEVARLFAWARMTVIASGAIASFAFVFADYTTQLLRLGEYSSSVWAALLILALTGINIVGLKAGKATQNVLTLILCAGLVLVTAAGVLVPAPDAAAVQPVSPPGALHLAMVFVLFTYGGWNDAAYLSAEIKNGERNIVRSLVYGLLVVTALYMLVSSAYLVGLGMTGLAKSPAPAADLLQRAWGKGGAALISVIVGLAAITSANATMLTGARTNYALGRDWPMFRWLGRWHGARSVPMNAMLLQAAIALALVVLGTYTRKGFQTMVEYTAPVFWLFFFLVGMSLFVFRTWETQTPGRFRVPYYPFTPLIFCGVCVYMLYSSLAYTGAGALVGVAVLAVGALLVIVSPRQAE
ncbi:MAG: APC family permease [Betaproteobacteria bacterium]|nr:APC family permease [Betaproteobacteria bacterium]MBI2960937.1 APC family permease [Betaproteobacteria bacterium]